MKKLIYVMMIISAMLLGIAGGILIAGSGGSIISFDTSQERGTVVERDYYIDIEQEPNDWNKRFSIHIYGDTTTKGE